MWPLTRGWTLAGLAGPWRRLRPPRQRLLGPGAVAGTALAAHGANAKLEAELRLKIHRRRRRGWRRWLPVPAWKRTVISTVLGAFTGLAATVVLLQTGAILLSLPAVVWGAVIGGGVTFGMGYSWGALLTYLRPPVDDSPQA